MTLILLGLSLLAILGLREVWKKTKTNNWYIPVYLNNKETNQRIIKL